VLPEPTIAVVVVTHNSGQDIDAFLESFADSRGDLELIVVDCGSTDQTIERVRRSGLRLTLLQGPNVGYAGGWNRAIPELSPSVTSVLFLNPDTTFGPTAVIALAAVLEEHPNFGAISPTLLDEHGRVAYAGGTLNDETFEVAFTRQPPPSPTPQVTGSIHGAAVMLRRDVLQKLAPFDERYFLFREEAGLALALRDTQWQLGYAPSVKVTHASGRSFSPYGFPLYAYYLTRNQMLFLHQATGVSRWTALRQSKALLWMRRGVPGKSRIRALPILIRLDAVAIMHFFIGRSGPRRRLFLSRPTTPAPHVVVRRSSDH